MKIEFKEEQRFTQWWLWLVLIAVAVFPLLDIGRNLYLQEELDNQSFSNLGLIVYYAIVLGVIALFIFTRLKTEIDHQEIRMNFFPFLKKRVSWQKVKSAKVVNYGFVGGWGIRWGTKYGTVFNMKGNKGLALELANGKKFLIGTQKETELQQIVIKAQEQH